MTGEQQSIRALGANVRKLRAGDRVEFEVASIDARGLARGAVLDELGRRYDATMRRGVPGDRWRAEVIDRRGERVELRGLELFAPGPERVAPRCAHTASCGGCSFQELAYGAQLRTLDEGLRALLASRPRLAGLEVDPIAGDAAAFGYRNKMEFSFSSRRWIEPGEPQGVEAGFGLGLHPAGRFDKVIDISSCAIVFERANALLSSARALALERGLDAWDARAHAGLLRHLVLRAGVNTGELLVNLVTSREARAEIDDYAAALLARHPEVTTFVQSINTRPADVAIGEWQRVLHGPGWIRERLLGLEFRISPHSFFQTNTRQAERLFTIVREEARLSGAELVYDLYSGTGSISLVLARDAARVLGFEQVPEAVADARLNARVNGCERVEFVEGDVLRALGSATGRPDLVVVDPPRAGLHKDVLPRILALAPRRIVWVSCNLRTALDDLVRLVEAGYAPGRVRPVDLFPHTPHLECVLGFERERA